MLKTSKWLISAFFIIVLSVVTVLGAKSKSEGLSVTTHEELEAMLKDSSVNQVTITLSNDISFTANDYIEFIYQVNGSITLDLNGSCISIHNASNLSGHYQDSTMFKVNSGSYFNIVDSSADKSGRIEYTGAIIDTPTHENKNPINAIISVNVFSVESKASLILNDITVSAGNHDEQWLHDAISISDGGFKYDTSLSTQVVCGTVATINNSGTLIINGGKYSANGRSRGNSLPNIKGWDDEKPASVCVRAYDGSTVTISDGCFYGNFGANVFDIHTNSKTTIKSGSFKCSSVENERASDYEGRHAFISGEYCGSIELPIWTVAEISRNSFYINGNKLDTSSTPVIRNTGTDTVVLSPSTNVSPSVQSTGISTLYTIGADASIQVNYRPYYDNSSKISYQWYVLLPNSTFKALPFTGNKLDLKMLSEYNRFDFKPGTEYEFGCIITEAFNITNSYVLTTLSQTYKLTTSDRNIIPSISLTPTYINDKNQYISGKVPTFYPPYLSNYNIVSTKWYNTDTQSPNVVTELIENNNYLVVFELQAINGYRFNEDTRISFLPGGKDVKLLLSNNGTNLTIYATVTTECSHGCTRTQYDHIKHLITCSVCGKVVASQAHTFSEWTINNTETQEFTRFCTICNYSETSVGLLDSSDEIKTISSLKIDFGQIYFNDYSTNYVPTIYDSPISSYVSILEFAWTDNDGNSFNKFEFNKKYNLAITIAVNDTEPYVFSNDLTVSSLYNSTVNVTLAEDGKTATVTFSVYALNELVSYLNLPKVTPGEMILSSLPSTPLNYFKFVWAENGKIIGSYDYINGAAANITDLDPNDDIDFSTHTFKDEAIYTLHVEWNAYSSSYVIYEGKGNVRLDISNATEYIFVKGFCGAILAKYDLHTNKTIVPVITLNGIDQPDSTRSPDKFATTPDSSYKITKVKWTLNDIDITEFICAKRYTVHITVKLLNDCCFFGDALTASVNSLKADIVYSGNEAVISFTFDEAKHNITNEKSIVLPDCTYDGSISVSCTECSYINSLTIDKQAHTLIYVAKKQPTCTEHGMLDHYCCIICSIYYTDIKGTNASREDILITSTEHEMLENCFDRKNHFDICIYCKEESDNVSPHVLSDVEPLPDGTSVRLCVCGYAYYYTPVVEVDPNETITDPTNQNGLLSGKIKLLVISAVAFVFVIILSIISISLYLILSRKSYNDLLLKLSEADNKNGDE